MCFAERADGGGPTARVPGVAAGVIAAAAAAAQARWSRWSCLARAVLRPASPVGPVKVR